MNKKSAFYTDIASMEPMFPKENNSELEELAIRLIKESSALSNSLHPYTRRTVARLLRLMNSYYSNLIEGHVTHPADIERALKKDFSKNPSKRLLQLESVAHIYVQEKLEKKLIENPDTEICSFEFLSWVHHEFYKQLSEDFREVKGPGEKTYKIIPGEMREVPVTVGNHVAPDHNSLEKFLARFKNIYGEKAALTPIKKIFALAASHHRLAWIHPFLDGNGRVTRLFSQAFLIKCDLGGGGLWTLSRGLARNREAYMTALAGADEPRRGDLDGRGNLSLQNLEDFCKFILSLSIDQVRFMADLLDIDKILERIKAYVELEAARGELAAESVYILTETFLRGSIARGEAPRLTGLSERSARDIVGILLDKELLISNSPKGVIHFGTPPTAIPYYFPRLYPESVEIEAKISKSKAGNFKGKN